MEPVRSVLASAKGGLDQSAITGKQHHYGYVGDGRLIGGRGVIFPASHRAGCDPRGLPGEARRGDQCDPRGGGGGG